MIVIDNISLISLEHAHLLSRYKQVSNLSKELLTFARELEIPIIVLCQLDSSAEYRKSSLANLGEDLDSLGQDADKVIFLYRENEEQEDNDEEVYKVKAIVAKNRWGETGGIATMNFEPKYTKFTDVGVG
ncbi:DnaB-like helicase C-terminal domain-containing protein (plasmid) [Borreliella yangtzensis]|uniref:DnaB-like helicase C-terminal domain-containing protein n=1 Tax=Borreliella yangtzensis TaxID=683292 RepID=UPI003B9DDA58